ncbi:uncharacterized protein LOC135205538 [Macrobrachium nipponense]|uniref:uncharacterized protein LOC135205538 n=1 Tax=Macrobrachium nipponense TaxID=159736 RepID=UPI0030C8AD03
MLRFGRMELATIVGLFMLAPRPSLCNFLGHPPIPRDFLTYDPYRGYPHLETPIAILEDPSDILLHLTQHRRPLKRYEVAHPNSLGFQPPFPVPFHENPANFLFRSPKGEPILAPPHLIHEPRVPPVAHESESVTSVHPIRPGPGPLGPAPGFHGVSLGHDPFLLPGGDKDGGKLVAAAHGELIADAMGADHHNDIPGDEHFLFSGYDLDPYFKDFPGFGYFEDTLPKLDLHQRRRRRSTVGPSFQGQLTPREDISSHVQLRRDTRRQFPSDFSPLNRPPMPLLPRQRPLWERSEFFDDDQ